MSRARATFILLAVATASLFAMNLFLGTVGLPAGEVLRILAGRGSGHPGWEYIVLEARLPQAITATLCGASLAVSGLLLQTAFRNPLAGPSVFGINSGASLGVALVMLLLGGGITAGDLALTGFLAVLAAAFLGAAAVMAILLLFANMVSDNVMLLIIGIMIGYISSSAISLLNFLATDEGVHSYAIWGLGNFGGVAMAQVPAFAGVTLLGLAGAMLLTKPLNAMLLGEQYAENLGVGTVRLRNRLLLVTGLLTAVTTAFCGPIAFIGLAVPHVARMLLATDDHRCLIPGTMLSGMAVALLCNLACHLPGEGGVIPLNAITPLFGAPVIIYIVLGSRRSRR